MALEIERKFLVKGDFKPFVKKTAGIIQGYLSSIPERTVRIRIIAEKGFLTVKGAGNQSGTSRFEFEIELHIKDAENLLKICEPGIIKKTRYLVDAGAHTFEVDVFLEENEGLTIAEIELISENETFEKPEWLGDEITGNIKYYNSFLVKNPYKTWKQKQ